MTPGEFALCISGWVMFASLVTVWIGRDRRAERLEQENRLLRRDVARAYRRPSTLARVVNLDERRGLR